jgi:hypothetical protein
MRFEDVTFEKQLRNFTDYQIRQMLNEPNVSEERDFNNLHPWLF